MSRFLVVFALLVGVVYSSFAQTRTWEKMKGPYGTGANFAFTIGANNTYFLATEISDTRHILRSTDDGKTWVDLPNTPRDYKTFMKYTMFKFELLSDLHGNLYMLYGHSDEAVFGLYASYDNGDTWSMVIDAVVDVYLSGAPGSVAAVTKMGSVVYSSDAGKHWSDLGHSFDELKTVYLGNGNFIQSVDYSAEARIKLSTYDIIAPFKEVINNRGPVQILPPRDGKVFAIVSDNLSVKYVFSSTDLYNWEKVAQFPSTVSKIIAPSKNTLMGFDNPTYYHPNLYAFLTGDQSPRLIQKPDIYHNDHHITADNLCVDLKGAVIYSTNDGLYRSTDNGISWEELPATFESVSYVQIDKEKSIFTKRGNRIEIDPISAHIYSNIDVSTNGGDSFKIDNPTGERVAGYIGPGHYGGIIATVSDTACDVGMDIWYHGTFESPGWKKLSRTAYPPLGALGGGCAPMCYFTLVDSANNVYIGEWLLYKSEDQGRNWDYEIKQPPMTAKTATFTPGWKMLVAGQGNKVAVSADGAKTWTTLTRLPFTPDGIVYSITAPTDDIIFVGTHQYGLYRSGDGGKSWEFTFGPWGDSITCLSYTKNNEVFIGTANRGLFSCNFDGLNPQHEPVNIPSNRILSMFVDKDNDVYVGTQGSSLWKSEGKPTSSVSASKRGNDYQAEIVHSPSGVSLRITPTTLQTFDISLFDALGKELRSLPDKSFSNGTYIIPFDMANAPAGSYFVRLRTNDTEQILKFQH